MESASLAAKEKKAGAENGEQSGGGLGDFVPDDLDPVDGGHVGCSGNVAHAHIKHACGEAIEADVVTGRGGLAIEVGIEAADSKARNILRVEIGGDSGIGKIDDGGGAVGSGVAVDEDIVVAPAEGAHVDTGDTNGSGDDDA